MKKKLLTKKMWLATSEEILGLNTTLDCSYIFLKNPRNWHPLLCDNKMFITTNFIINNKSINAYGRKHPIRVLLTQITNKSEIQKNSCIMFEKVTVLGGLCIVSAVSLSIDVVFREGFTVENVGLIFGKKFVKELPDNQIVFFKINLL